MTASLHFAEALLPSGWARDVRVEITGGCFTLVETGVAAGPGDQRYAVALPGLPNLHSHAFQRGMAGMAERRGLTADNFWTWRETMYRFVDRIEPGDLQAIAAMAYAEMLESGFTRVGEFHYLHHDPTGVPYSGAPMAQAIAGAAEESGIALTLLPVFYAHAGFGGQSPGPGQRRFVCSLDQFAALHAASRTALAALPDAVLGLAPHSLRAVTPDQLSPLIALADGHPIHIHVAEQQKEVADCIAWSGARPVEWLLGNTAVDQRWCLVHATHMTVLESDLLAASGAVAGLCPITEANLGDGLFPAPRYIAAGGRWGIGSDSNVKIDAGEELRWLEYGQRLGEQARNVFAADPGASTGAALYNGALLGGAQALGAPMGIAAGNSADFLTLDPGHPSLIGAAGDGWLDRLIFAAGRSAINTVWRHGTQLVAGGRHHSRERIAARYRAVLTKLLA
jgi:formiminoglutamate deiminase